MTDANNLLVIDWDYFFPVPDPANCTVEEFFLYDWGHSEGFGTELTTHLWVNRAATFDRNGIARPQMNLEWTDGWWDRFHIDPDALATLFYADSNVHAYSILAEGHINRPDQVWLYDAHHDSGYTRTPEDIRRDNKVSCEDWMIGYQMRGAELHVRYPRWKPWAMEAEQGPTIEVDRQVDDFADNPVEFSAVFVCRSGSWVPPWTDAEFWDFITDAPVNELYDVDPHVYKPRDWDEAWVQQDIQAWEAFQEHKKNL